MALSIAPGQLGKAAENNEQHCCASCTCVMVVVTGVWDVFLNASTSYRLELLLLSAS